MIEQLRIIADRAKQVVYVGDVAFTAPDLYRRHEHNYEIKNAACGTNFVTASKFANSHFAQHLGPKFNFRFQAAMYDVWLKDRCLISTSNMLRQPGRYWWCYSNTLVLMASKVWPYINEAEADGLHNLIPPIVAFGKSPGEIKKIVGKGMWKRIAHNSITRNVRILQSSRIAGKKPEQLFVYMQDIPSGLVNTITHQDEISLYAARITPTHAQFNATYAMILDTKRMLGDSFNPAWGYARIKDEHDKATKEHNRRAYPDTPFAEPWSLSNNLLPSQLKATLLTSQLAVATEGAEMHHCVASYAREAGEKTYAVIKIEGDERATAGYILRGNLIEEPYWSLHQVFGVGNAKVRPETVAFAFDIAHALSAHHKPSTTTAINPLYNQRLDAVWF